MRFYSDELKKFFATEAECLAAEEQARVFAEEKKVTKSKLAKAIEDADKELDGAYDAFEEARKKVAELQKEYDAKVDDIMSPVVDYIKKCIIVRATAIKEFNDKFGVYTTTYTGNKALNELDKATNLMNQLWKKLYF